MAADTTQTFADALEELEAGSDVEHFVAAVFADDTERRRPETAQHLRGIAGARRFWRQYVDQFDDVDSEFSRVVEGPVGVLEWTSRGHLRGGAPITYSGVSLLDVDSAGRVTRFTTYYDTSAFTNIGIASA